MAIQIKNLSYTYLKKTPNEVEALHDVSLKIPENKITAIVGHTGSGKSTLIQTLNGLITPTSGSINSRILLLQTKRERTKELRN